MAVFIQLIVFRANCKLVALGSQAHGTRKEPDNR